MVSSWLPSWLAAAWAVAFIAVALVHAAHLVTLRGGLRWWHVTHLLTAAGMLAMVTPGHGVLSARRGITIFALATAAVLVVITTEFIRGRWTSVWPVAALDLAAMALMYALMSAPSPALALPLAAWFVVEAGGWASGWLVSAARRDFATTDLGLTADALLPPPLPEDTTGSADSSSGRAGHQMVAVAAPAAVTTRRAHRHESHARSIRITLTVMAIGMAYMSLALVLGTHSMSGM